MRKTQADEGPVLREGTTLKSRGPFAAPGHAPHARALDIPRAIDSRLPHDMVRVLLNIIWLVLSGIWLAIGYALAGILMCILIITIPFGVQAFKLAGYSLWPFGRTVVKKPTAGAGSVIGNLIWLVLAGWWLALAHIISAFFLAITIIGIPLALGNLKLVPVALWPFGREIVPMSEVSAALGDYRMGDPPLMPPPVELPADQRQRQRQLEPPRP
jgi:uncharacterized membrane protein YccF (DUF307 family)